MPIGRKVTSYNRYGNRLSVTPNGVTANNQAVPSDGLSNQSYDAPSNRINTAGYQYDLAGNLARGQDSAGNWQLYEYDGAGKLTRIKTDSGTILETYVYGADRHRLINLTANGSTYYAWGGASVICEYSEAANSSNPIYSKSYVYAGSRLLSTYTNNNGAETLQLQHPDRLGTKLVTTPSNATQFEQATLPFGTSLDAETSGTTNQRFTSYDRSSVSNLDYAVNRSYSSSQSRFTQVDPIGASATEMGNPQSMNLYAYAQNNPVDFTDPSGLFSSGIPEDEGPPIRIEVHGDPWNDPGWQHFLHDSEELSHPPATNGDPGVHGGRDTDNSRILEKLKEKVIDRVKKFPDCAALFDKINVADVLKNNTYIGDKRPSGSAFSSQLEAANTKSDTGEKGERLSTGKIGFNQNSFLFTDKVATDKKASDFFGRKEVKEKNGFGNLNYSEIKELVIIHELVHLNDTAGKWNDFDKATGKGKVNKELNTEIANKCFKK